MKALAVAVCTATAGKDPRRYSRRILVSPSCTLARVSNSLLEQGDIERGAKNVQVEAPPVDQEEYEELRNEYNHYRAMGDMREPYRIPKDYMLATKKLLAAPLPDAPLIVFINSRSGGRAGARLTQVLCHAVGSAQVCTIG